MYTRRIQSTNSYICQDVTSSTYNCLYQISATAFDITVFFTSYTRYEATSSSIAMSSTATCLSTATFATSCQSACLLSTTMWAINGVTTGTYLGLSNAVSLCLIRDSLPSGTTSPQCICAVTETVALNSAITSAYNPVYY